MAYLILCFVKSSIQSQLRSYWAAVNIISTRGVSALPYEQTRVLSSMVKRNTNERDEQSHTTTSLIANSKLFGSCQSRLNTRDLTSSSVVTNLILSGSPTRLLNISELTYPAFTEQWDALYCLATIQGHFTQADALFSRQLWLISLSESKTA